MTVNPSENILHVNLPQDKPEAPVVPPADAKPIEEDPNWKAFREGRRKDRIDKEAAEKKAAEAAAEAAALKAAMEAAFAKDGKNGRNRSRNQEEDSYPSEDEETEDQRIEKKVSAAIAAREQANERARQEREQQEYPQRLNQQYSDFNQTISAENLDYLEYHFPEVASPLKRLGDGYDKWHDIYKAVKKFVPNSIGAKKDASKANENFMKPKSMSSSEITQPGATNGGGGRLSEERKAENWARMQKLLKGIS